MLTSDLDEIFERPAFNQTGLRILLENSRVVRENVTEAVYALEYIEHFTKHSEQSDALKQLLNVSVAYLANYANFLINLHF